MFGSGWMLDSHTILMMILLVVAVIYLIQNSNNNESGSESKQLVAVKKRKSARKENKENFQDKKNKEKVKFVMYYVPWCPHCRTSKPEWKKLEEYAKENLPWATVESVDCEKNPSVAEKNDIEYFPTMVITKEGTNSEYEGPRAFADMKKFLENH